MNRLLPWVLLAAVLSATGHPAAAADRTPIHLVRAAAIEQSAGRPTEVVAVRTGRHEGYTRLVLEWPAPVGHRIDREGSALVVTFDRPFAADVLAIRSGLARLGVDVVAPSGSTMLRLVPARALGVKSFATGNRVVIDLYDDPGAVPALPGATEAAAPAPSTTAVAVRGNEEKGRLRLVVDWTTDVAHTLDVRDGTATVRFPVGVELDPSALARRTITLARDIRVGKDAEGAWMRFAIADGAAVEASRSGHKLVIDIVAGAASVAPAAPPAGLPIPGAKPDRPAVSAVAVQWAVPRRPTPTRMAHAALASAERDDRTPPHVSEAVPASYAPMLARRALDGERVVLRFIVNRPVAAAAMVREGRLWLAFDGRYDVAVVAAEGTDGSCSDLRQIERRTGTLLSCSVPEGVGAEVTRDGTAWRVRLTPTPATTGRVLALDAADPATARIAAKGLGAPIDLALGEGRRLVFVPTLEAAAWPGDSWHGRSLLMATSQGMALEVEGEGTRVTAGPSVLEIATDAAAASMLADSLLDPRHWPLDLDPAAVEAELALDRAPEGRDAKRLGLIQWQFARGRTADALGQLGLLVDEDPGTLARPEVRALFGAVLARGGRIEEAATYLDDPALRGTHVELWRAVLDSLRGRHADVAGRIRLVSDDWVGLDPVLRTWIGVRLARALALGGRPAEAEDTLRAALGEAPDAEALSWAALVRADALAASGHVEEAEPLWAEAARSTDRWVSAEARTARAERLLAAGKLTPEQAMAELELLDFAWRGDDRERARNALLVDLYRKAGRHRDALRAMRTMVSTYPDAPETPALAAAMTGLFRDVMVGEAAASLGPLDSLAIFYEFEELASTDENGTDLAELLADRLAAVDLVDSAGDLLARRIEGGIAGPERARIGARLAELRLLGERPGEALDALAATNGPDVHESVRLRRRVAEAKALAALGRDADALAVIAGVPGPDAARFRADIHWNRGDWADAARELERVLAAPAAPLEGGAPRPIGDDALRLAVAYAMVGDQGGLARLRARLLPAAAEDDPRRGILDLVTKTNASRPLDWANVSDEVADIAAFEAFLAAYRGAAAPEAALN